MGTDIGGNEGEDKGKVNGEDDGDNTWAWAWAWGTMMACGREDRVRTGMWLCYCLTIFI